ncbi:MAG: hypothetical protein COV52_03995 [Gammaproteobacteria bacterium CG11_big_fil_rev_8_21_14_0_20_46_22]|nr:MAG: hypothetical protein COW05_04190 [Gammaproteobacteria bacterium CG12_big_fil_rev_8_21_14_0_65_46_12]PIR11359.1 MAG: hypothetical protein COV52_03995 [Gammaproteobacteria bacterium CG11_big_fil_rev_8_21_14_0_20_46_22]
MRLSRLFLSLAGLQVFVVTAFAASVPTPPTVAHATNTSTTKHLVSAKQANQMLADTYQHGVHVFVGAGAKYENFSKPMSMRAYTATTSGTHAAFDNNFGTVIQRNITFGLHFRNNYVFPTIMGSENSVSLTYGFVTDSQDRAADGSGTVDVNDGYVNGGSFENSQFNSYTSDGKLRNYDLALAWTGHKVFANPRFSMDPSLSLVSHQYKMQTNNQINYTFIAPPEFHAVEFATTQIKYYGLKLADQFNFQATKQVSLGAKFGVQALHGDAHFKVWNTALSGDGGFLVPFTLHKKRKISLRETVELSMRLALFNRQNSAYFKFYGGTTHWDWAPYATSKGVGSANNPRIASGSMWVPYWGINFVVPYA